MQNFKLLNKNAKNPILISCEHASSKIPKRYSILGIKRKDLKKVSDYYDIGAKEVSKILSRSLDAECILANYSRLLIDVNRSLSNPSLIKESSFGFFIPGNQKISLKDKEKRIRYYHSYHNKLKEEIDRIKKQDRKGHLISVHSFNNFLDGKERKMDIGILYRFNKDKEFCKRIKKELDIISDWDIRFNEPYSAMKTAAFCLNKYGKNSRLRCVELEINDKHLKDKRSIKNMGKILSTVLKKIIRES